MANTSEKIREARLKWLGHVERRTEEDVVMRTWKWVDTECYNKRHEGENSNDRRSTRPENVEIGD